MDRVDDGDRNAAKKAVEAALAEGRIVQADRDRRVDQLKYAQTTTELQMITQDLAHRATAPAWTTYEPPQTDPSEEASPAPQVNYGPPQDQMVAAQVTQMYGTKPPGGSRALILVPIIFFLVIAIGAGAVILSVVGNIENGSDETFGGFDPFDGFEDAPGPGDAPPPDLFTPGGFRDLLDSLREETGRTAVFESVLYSEYAVTTAPAEAEGKRSISYYFDGDLTESTKSTSTYERFDLSTIDPTVLGRLTRKTRMLVDDPTSYYVIVRKPQDDSTTWLSAYASNDFGESGYLRAEKDGTVIDRSVS
ncbi:hypothetical protein NPS01_13230 [Nocardioides psychrotolerans]|uniref:DUF1707 domain-containing protein n=1 Tax=Nocardioides psychrotolerans TaxID=1005945 RepID=A0A1I3HCR8_9ACTN|nr:DUF1707 domain-containing protein [Nocardioides psychrotolerans]GEP37660.1 hypothetical protein NPS01_13230 [Nocardioides psychrotolerans]SFI33350.1 protein of unknown function [Nocardioides psychrotolerans]